MTDTDFELLLENWVRWSKTRYGLRRVQSLEGNWRSKQPWDAPVTPRPPIDKLAAERVEDAWKSLTSSAHKLLLKWHYVYLRPVWGIVKSLRLHGITLHPMDYDYEVRKAARMLKNAIDIGEKRVEDSRHNLNTAPRSLALMAGRTATLEAA